MVVKKNRSLQKVLFFIFKLWYWSAILECNNIKVSSLFCSMWTQRGTATVCWHVLPGSQMFFKRWTWLFLQSCQRETQRNLSESSLNWTAMQKSLMFPVKWSKQVHKSPMCFLFQKNKIKQIYFLNISKYTGIYRYLHQAGNLKILEL